MVREQLERDFERFGRALPRDFPDHVREHYRIDLSARYLGFSIPHPVGKGSGQLSLNQDQLESDRDSGLAFVVLKTVIARGRRGRAEHGCVGHPRDPDEGRAPALGRRVRRGGRSPGRAAAGTGRSTSISLWCEPRPTSPAAARSSRCRRSSTTFLALDEAFREAEYRHTTEALAHAWGTTPLPLEKDFSPTLAGDRLAEEQAQILRWLREVPARIRAVAPVRLALKLMNARHDDEFQLRMTDAAGEADALVVFNRLWSPERGVAYGGHDLSDRNLRVLGALRVAVLPSTLHSSAPETSAPAGSSSSTPAWVARASSFTRCSSCRSRSIPRPRAPASSGPSISCSSTRPRE